MSLGVYIHVPFCIAKCPYCHFSSHIPTDDEVKRFPVLLSKEITTFLTKFHKGPSAITTIYFGGGTPSLLMPDAVGSVLDAIRTAYPVEPDAEITIEVNPGKVTREKIVGYRACGVNRLSLGIQSFTDSILRFLGRSHRAKDSRQALDWARPVFDNLSLDLMYAIPSQTDDMWIADLHELKRWTPEHLSAYSLTRETGTPMAKRLPIQSDEVQYLRQQLVLLAQVEILGLERYELTNFSRPGFRSRHNSNYWNGEPYLGFGPSAHSLVDGRRFWNTFRHDIWERRVTAGRSPQAGTEKLTRADLYRERLLLGLRTVTGVDMNLLAETDPLRPHLLERTITAQLVRSGLAEVEGDYLRLRPEGMAVSDEIIRRLI